ncbi:MAG: PDZ domain-containing protein [Candidatus Cloacimonadales bacterium]|nr:PDZ domain-containing protein [Candidatus Cloacimonadales bacterium]
MKLKIFAVLIILLGLSIASCENPQIAMFEKFKGGIPGDLKEDIIIPFTLQHSHLIEVTATIKEMPYTMILDTGGMTMLEKSVNDSLEFETMEIPQQNAVMAIVDELKLGNASVAGMKVGLVGFNDTFKFELPGMIGSDYLRFFNVEIDYEKQNVTLRNPQKMTAKNDSEHLMDIEMVSPYFPTIELLINEKHKFPGMIDTGLPYAFVFPISWLENLSEAEKENLVESEGYFVRWPWTESPQNYFYLMPEIKLGDIVLEDVPVIFGEVPVFLNNSTALIGKYFLENYLTTIDYPNRQVKFTNAEESNYSLRYSAGINIAKKDEKLQITGVWQNSPAFESGLHPTDELIAVNGKSYDEISEIEIADTIMNKTIAEFYITIRRDGKEESILLRKRDLFE